jgi:hypothetical protein
MYIVASDLEPKGSRQSGDNRIALGKGNESMPHFALRAAASPKQIAEKYDADGLSSARGHIVSPWLAPILSDLAGPDISWRRVPRQAIEAIRRAVGPSNRLAVAP